MNILLVTGIFPPDHGGPASYVPAIAEALSGRGHRIVGVVTLSDTLDHDDTGYGFPVIRILRRGWKLSRQLRTIRTIHGLASEADVIYLNGLVLEGILACKIIVSKPVVTKVVGDLIWEMCQNRGMTHIGIQEFQNRFIGGKFAILKKLQDWYTCRADAIITPSKFLSRIIQGWGVSDGKICVIYNAIKQETDDESFSGDVEFDIISIGRMIFLKRMDALIRVCVANGWRLCLVGDGPERGRLEALAHELGGEALIKFVGHLPKTAIPSVLKLARVFVLNSTHEGFPHVVLEAKAAGVPVVATDVGGIPELVNHRIDGILIPASDDAALAEALRELLADAALRHRLSEAARNQIKQHFSWETLVAQTEKVLSSAMYQSGRV